MNGNEISRLLDRAENLFFVGIGGISMSSIAFVFASKGYKVRGSDRAENDMTKKLISSGISVFKGHDAKNVAGADAVIYTGAVSFENPEIKEAKRLGIPLVYRADALSYLMAGYKTRIGVSGSHGKSTCTAMISHILMSAKKDPCVMCGAELPEMCGAYRIGSGKTFVFEACEYKDSFLEFIPSVSVILNIDIDHTDYFTNGIEQIKSSFRKYAMIPFSVSDSPAVISNADDLNTVSALHGIEKTTFGKSKNAFFRADDIVTEHGKSSFNIMRGGSFFCAVSLSVPGEHNIYNALAAAAVCELCGVSSDVISSALSSFEGLERRFEYSGDVNGASVYTDYAHHPREIAASILSARGICGDGKIYCVFEPHTYSRTAALFDDFSASFAGAEKVVFVDIYAAREKNTFGVDSKMLAESTKNGEYAPSYEAAAERIRSLASKDDIVLVLGAGSVNEIAPLICKKYKNE